MTTFDSLEIARQLTGVGMNREHAEAIAAGISRAAEHGDYVTPDRLDARAAAAELRLIRWIVATGIAIVAAGVGVAVALLRVLPALAGGG